MCQMTLDKILDLVLVDLRFIRYDVRTWYLVSGSIGSLDTDDGGVEDVRVRDEVGFEFGGGDLETLVLDEFLIRQYKLPTSVRHMGKYLFPVNYVEEPLSTHTNVP